MNESFERIMHIPGFYDVVDELQSALSLYWTTAKEVLHDGGIALLDPPEGYPALENNFFSAMFLYSYHRLEIPPPRRILYAATNQCFRGMVTGCDNLLDDEYKRTLETDLPAGARRFRSVLDIMVSEHVLFTLLSRASCRGDIPEDRLLQAVNAALRALTRSGAQEAGEEGGLTKVLPPETIIKSIHHFKTGILFQSPWAIPEVLETTEAERKNLILEALYRIGMGCQIMDDLVDLRRDAVQERHNYVASIIYYNDGVSAWASLKDMNPSTDRGEDAQSVIRQFPEPIRLAVTRCLEYLHAGISALLDRPSPELVQTVISILAKRIGADTYLTQGL